MEGNWSFYLSTVESYMILNQLVSFAAAPCGNTYWDGREPGGVGHTRFCSVSNNFSHRVSIDSLACHILDLLEILFLHQMSLTSP